MGGEWAGATVVTAESAPVHRRGYYGMHPQVGPALGFILSSATFSLTTLTMSDAAFLSWGWRVPFLASAVLIVVGFVGRMALEEPEEFQKKVRSTNQAVRKLPVAELFRFNLSTGGSLQNSVAERFAPHGTCRLCGCCYPLPCDDGLLAPASRPI